MKTLQLRAQDFAGDIEMPQISPGKMLTTIAIAVFVNGAGVPRKLRALDAELSVRGKHAAPARIPRGQHAIEKVVTTAYGVDQILRSTHAHQVPRPISREKRSGIRADFIQRFFSLAHGQPAHSESIKGEARQFIRAVGPQLRVNAALDDCEKGHAVFCSRPQGSLSPPDRASGGRATVIKAGRLRNTLVEDHGDIAAESLLNGDDFLRGQAMP